jgi:deoxyribodipyrimidine photo-lyase
MSKRSSSSSSSSSSTKRVKLEKDLLNIKVDESKVDRSRVRLLSGPSEPNPKTATECVVYWMSRDQRMNDNWAFLYAQERAIEFQLPLCVAFSVVPRFLEATIRQFGFMLKGLKEVESSLNNVGIPFFLLTGHPTETIPAFVQEVKPALVVTDYSPLRVGREWKDQVGSKLSPEISFVEVDAHNIVPVWEASSKIEYAARTIRPKINKKLDRYLVEFPPVVSPHPYPWISSLTTTCSSSSSSSSSSSPSTNWDAVIASLQVNRGVPEVDWIIPGESAAIDSLSEFLNKRFKLYEKRNDPNVNGCSNLSPYLHFGQISAQRCALEAKKAPSMNGARDSFLEELIIRRELTDNYCHYNPHGYDQLGGLYPQYDNDGWAQKSLRLHQNDKREYIYSRDQFEKGQTHDDLWNACQLEMVHHGKMHGFLRMYWAKKILEWTPSPEEALQVAIWLNDKYELDGRDPNGYVGCAWAIAGLHDQGWREREVFGKIRYMNYKGCSRKFSIPKYVSRISKMVKAVLAKK